MITNLAISQIQNYLFFKNPNNETHAPQVDSLCQKSKSMMIFIQLHGISDASYSIT
jgi:hypothetical protein